LAFALKASTGIENLSGSIDLASIFNPEELTKP